MHSLNHGSIGRSVHDSDDQVVCVHLLMYFFTGWSIERAMDGGIDWRKQVSEEAKITRGKKAMERASNTSEK